MSKKFDVVIGNPPYQDEKIGNTNSTIPIYPHFMNAAYEVGTKAVLITPARFLFNAGYTSAKWNRKMLDDPHLSVPIYEPDSTKLFPGTDIKGGVAVTFRDSEQILGPIGIFSRDPVLDGIRRKVWKRKLISFATIVSKRDSFKFTDKMHQDHPQSHSLMSKSSYYIVNANAFKRLPFLFSDSGVAGSDLVKILGVIDNVRCEKWIKESYLNAPASFNSYRVVVSKANGTGKFGEALSEPIVIEPKVAVTQTFLTLGDFPSYEEAHACLKYVSSKFSRALLGVLKITQDNPSEKWKYVPLQDFSSASDIDWSRSVAEIDQQLYVKYGLSAEEIEFIESHVKPME